MIVTVKPLGRSEYRLDLDGVPRFASSLSAHGYESAEIPVEWRQDEYRDLLGARLRIHGTSGIIWQGIVTRRPSRDDPLQARGWGWCGSLGRREALYCDTQTSVWRERVWAKRNVDIRTTYDSTGIHFGYSEGVILPSGARNGLWREIPDTDTVRVSFDWSRPSTATAITLYSNDTPDTTIGFVGATQEWTQAWATGALSGSATVDITTAGTKYLMFTVKVDTGATQTGQSVSITNLKVYGTTLTTVTTGTVASDIISNEIDTEWLPSGAAYLAWIDDEATTVEPLVYESGTADQKFDVLSQYAAYDYGWYMEHVAGIPCCVPHWSPRSTTPDYVLKTHEAEPGGVNIEESSLDELASVARVHYETDDGQPTYVDVTDTDTDHPLVRLGITRYTDIDAQTSSSTVAAEVGAIAVAERGRQQVKGSVTTRYLYTATGVPAYLPSVRPGEMVRVEGLDQGPVDCIIRRVECTGDDVSTLTLDNEPYRLDIALARLAKRE
jgi:hypothetical protein